MDPLPEWIICLRLIYVIIIFLVAVTGNGTIILVQLKNRKKSSTDCLILAMAIFDFFIAGIVAPMVAVQSFTEVWSNLSSDWTCKFYMYTVCTSTFASTQLLAAVAFDRYRNTCKPHATWFSPRTAAKLSIFVTLNSMIVCSIMLFITGAKKHGACGTYEDRRTEGMMFNISLATLFFIMIVIVTVCYSMVASTLHKRHRQKVQTNQHGPVRMSTNTSSVSLFRKNNKVGVADATLSTINDTLARHKPRDKQEMAPEPGPSFIRDETKPTMATQEPTKRSSDELGKTTNQFADSNSFDRASWPSFARNETTSMDNQKEQLISLSDISNSTNAYQNCGRFLGWQSSDRATCGPTPCRTIENRRTEDADFGKNENGDRRQTADRKLTSEEHKINKTTKMMFLITVIYTVSWMTVWTAGAFASIGENGRSELGLVLTKLLNLTYMINSVSNPILYILMSSLFRKRVRALFSKNAQLMTQ